jgi:hypothetical protein
MASFIRVTRIGELGTTSELTSNRSTLRRKRQESAKKYLFFQGVLRLLVTASVVPNSLTLCHPDDGGDMFLQNVDYYKSHTA